jgi:outer membrane immunogenic protein
MKRIGARLLGLAASCTLASASMAADLGSGPRRSSAPEPIPYQAPFKWTGFYFGTHLGYGWSDVDWTETAPAFNGSHDGSGWLAGGQIGFNLQSGRLVYGVEADISNSWIDGSSGCCEHEINWLASVRARAGLTGFSNRTLFYVTGGAAWADIDYASTGSDSDTHFGWVAGAGIEHALTPNWSARVEYLYYSFDDVTSGAVAPGTATLDPNLQTVRFGLNFKF